MLRARGQGAGFCCFRGVGVPGRGSVPRAVGSEGRHRRAAEHAVSTLGERTLVLKVRTFPQMGPPTLKEPLTGRAVFLAFSRPQVQTRTLPTVRFQVVGLQRSVTSPEPQVWTPR